MDPHSPPPQPVYFDREARAWIVTRYADVKAALREPALQQEHKHGKRKEGNTRAEVLAALSAARLAEWQKQIEPLAREMCAALPTHRPIDLVREFIEPWTQEAAILALPVRPARKQRLRRILRQRAASSGPFGSRRALAAARYRFFFRDRAAEKSIFIGISETLPGFLANAWLSLLRHPAQMVCLRDHPEAIPSAIEELLRYAGLVHSLARRAVFDVEIAEARVAVGDAVILKLASANRDPQQFCNANDYEPARRCSGHLALGHGDHACPGASLLRLASAAITQVFVDRFANARLMGQIEWRRGDTLVSPAALTVTISQ